MKKLFWAGLCLALPYTLHAQQEAAPAVEAARGALEAAGTAAAPQAAPVPGGEGASGEQGMTAEQFETTLKYQQGKITLHGGIATLDIPAGFRYLGPDDAEKILVTAWGNPPSEEKTLGMIFPADISPLEERGWGVIISHQEDGYVKDDDAESIDYTDLLKEMQADTKAANPERTKAGYPALELVGWAQPPHYDKAAHKLYWAKELKVEGAPVSTLNYDIRVLGRKGVLVLSAISSMAQLQEIERDMKSVLTFVNYTPGNRYEDFDSNVDEVAAYGIGALVAGKVAAKAGLFKGLLALIVAGKKFIIFGAVAAVGVLKSLLGRGKDSGSSSA